MFLKQNELCVSGPPAPTIESAMSSNSEEISLDWLTTRIFCCEDRRADFYEVFYRAPRKLDQSFQVNARNLQSATISNLTANTLYTVAVRINSGFTRSTSGEGYIRSDRSAEDQVTTGDLLRFNPML